MTHKTPFSNNPSVEKPSARPGLRQLPVPKVLQAKMSQPGQATSRRTAPPAYRPQPVPKVLQRKTAVVLQQTRTTDGTPVLSSRAVIQRAEKRGGGPRRKEGKQEATITVGKVSMTHDYYHRVVKPAIMAKLDLADLLGRKGAQNADFWFERDGTILVGPNGSGGKNGQDTGLNLYVLFPGLKPQEAEVAPQQRNLGLPPTDSDEDESH